ncbi:MAG: hypothetical protein L3J98_11320 [Gammaproteobacteria bacterium]|nr:hypothetical protein [Gammaproteobacteria bacterium]
MASPGLSTTLILGEIILIETLLIISVSVYFVMKLKKKSAKLKNLLESFLDDESNRLSILSENLKKPEFIDDEKYNTVLKNIINEENLLYKHLVNAFYNNDIKSLGSLSTEIQKITGPCADLLIPVNEVTKTKEIDNEQVINADDVMDELLSDDEEIEADIDVDVEHDPEFDLSESAETINEPPPEEPIKTSIENDEIAEIPSDLLNNIPSTNENESSSEDDSENVSENASENDKADSGHDENKTEK